MTTIAIANFGGSAGKTTTAVSLATIAALSGIKTDIWDLDSQANASFWLGVELADDAPTSARVMLRDVTLADARIQTAIPNLRLVPANETVAGDAIRLSNARAGDVRLRNVLADDVDPPEMIIIDCNGGDANYCTINAFIAARYVIGVATPGLKEIMGLPKVEGMTEAFGREPDLGGAATFAAVVPCAVRPRNAGRAYSEALEMIQENYSKIVTPPVRHSVRVGEAYARQSPLPVYDKTADVTGDYEVVYKHLVAAGILP